MNTLQHDGHLMSLSSRKDGSIRYSVETPELSSEEKAIFFELHGKNLIVTLKPMDYQKAEEYKINKDLENKSPSQRLRDVLYVYWRQLGSKGYFDDFYRKSLEKSIELVKQNLQ